MKDFEETPDYILFILEQILEGGGCFGREKQQYRKFQRELHKNEDMDCFTYLCIPLRKLAFRKQPN